MKALRTAAFVVGAVALVATGVGAAVGAVIIGGVAAGATSATFLGVTAATFSAIGTLAGVAAGAISLASIAAQPKGTVGGNPTKFTINKDSGYPYAMGRTLSGGRVAHRQYYGSKNSLESWVTVHSIGPVKSLGPLLIDKAPVSFSSGAATSGSYAGHMWLDEQLGACPEPASLQGPQGAFPGWDGVTSKISGLAADLWTLKLDEKGKVYPNGVPQRARMIEGVFVYDPRFDSTYPGGSGSCRLGQEETYVWSENPALHAITWAFGRIQNGMLIAGGGLKVNGIDLAPFVEWANVCEVNNWKVGGVVYTADDDSWDVLKMIAQAGGGEVMPVGAMLSCTFSAPRVSIGLITSADIMGEVDAPSSASRRVRRNTVIPRVRLESHGWEEVPLNAIEIADYIAVDGGRRPKEVRLPLVQDANQGAELGLYEVMNARELTPILPCKVYAIGYRPGDCLTIDIPEASLNGRDVIVREREIDGGSMGVTLTCRTETPSKHEFVLGKTGTPPPTPDLSVPPAYPVEAELQGAARVIIEGTQSVAFPVAPGVGQIAIQAFTAATSIPAQVSFPSATITGLAAATKYIVLYDMSAATYIAVGATTSAAFAAVADPDNIIVRYTTTPNEDGTYPTNPTPPDGDGGGGYSGGYNGGNPIP